MAYAPPALAPKVTEALDNLRASGIFPTDAEVGWLIRLRVPCDTPDDGSLQLPMGSPLNLSGVDFWPLHRLGSAWFRRVYQLLDGYPVMRVWSYLYAHAQSNPGNVALRNLTSLDALRVELTAWADSIPVHDLVLDVLCDELSRIDGDIDCVPNPDALVKRASPTGGNSDQTFCAAMCKAFPGVPPEYWLTGISEHDAMQMLESAGDHGCFATSTDRKAHVRNFLNAIKQIRDNHR